VPYDNPKEAKISGFVKMKNDNEKPQSLSATSDGRLVVLVSIENSFSRTWRGRLDIYLKGNKPSPNKTLVEPVFYKRLFNSRSTPKIRGVLRIQAGTRS
jgi:hypothetical protein